MKSVKAVSVVVVMVVAGLAQAVPLGTVDIAHTGFGASDIIKIWGGGRDGIYGYAGVYMLTKSAGSGEGDLWSDGIIGSLCIDLPENAPTGVYTYDVVMPEEAPQPTTFLGGYMGVAKADYIRELWGRFFDTSWMTGECFTDQQNSDAEAFTAAMWEIIYEELPESPSQWDVTVDGTAGELGFRCENADTATANNWLHSLDGTGPKANLRALCYDGKQDYIVEVPEPATVALLGLGGLALLGRKRK